MEENTIIQRRASIIEAEFIRMEEEKKKKIEEYSKKIFGKNGDENLYCVCVDGSKHSEYAFDVVSHHFLTPEQRLLLVFIYNDKMDEFYNYQNKKETVISTYKDKILPIENQAFFHYEDRISEVHVLEQVMRISAQYKANFLFVGLFGIKGPRSDKKELTKGVNYLLGNAKMPVVLIQENVMKLYKEKKSLKWLFVFDRQYSYCKKIMNTFFPLVNKDDLVYGLTLLPPTIYFDDVEKEFNEEVSSSDFTNVQYEKIQYDTNSYAKELVTRINFGEILFDFVVFYNNNDKYKIHGENSDSYYIVSRSKANLCFVY